MSALDLGLLVAVVAFAVSGYRQGFLVGALSFVGLLGGGALGAVLAPRVGAVGQASGGARIVLAVAVVVVVAVLGQLLATALGASLRRRLTAPSTRTLDSAGGAVLSALSVLLVAWLIATAVAHASLPALARSVRQSQVLAAVDRVMPGSATTWFSSFRRLVNESGFPQVFEGIGGQHAAPVSPPDPSVAGSAAVRRARSGIVKIVGSASSCSRRITGTGFVYAPQRVLTNAHVVAGVRRPTVLVSGSDRKLSGRVVVYDARRDVAVVQVPGLRRDPLRFAGPAQPGDAAVVAGFPEQGPFTAVAARVRGRQRARGPDIYQRSQVTRDVYALRARVRPGNSGGPLLAPDGRVYGVVFAAAVDDPDTGYALTAAEVAGSAAAGARATEPVSTQECD